MRERLTMLDKFKRAVSRHLVPSFISVIYYFAKYRCLINSRSRVQLSDKISFGEGCVVKAYSIIQTSGGRISFGKNCAVGSFNLIATRDADITIGDNVRFGGHVNVQGVVNNYRKRDELIIEQGYTSKGIQIGNDVLISAGAVILDGCQIGDGAVIGVGSIVTKNVDPYSVVFGSPAKVIFNRF